jgi:hypothetical protein
MDKKSDKKLEKEWDKYWPPPVLALALEITYQLRLMSMALDLACNAIATGKKGTRTTFIAEAEKEMDNG